MWKTSVERATDDNTAHVHYMLGTYDYTHTHTHARSRAALSKYVILIAFPPQQWFHERASILYTYLASFIFQSGSGDNTFLRNVGILILCFTVSIPRNVFAYMAFCGLSHRQYEYWERIPIQQEHNDAALWCI